MKGGALLYLGRQCHSAVSGKWVVLAPEGIESLIELGFAVHWLHPRSKRPIGDDWSTRPVASLKQLRQTYRDGNNVGVRLGKWSKVDEGYLHAFDVDIRKAKYADDAWDELEALLPGVRIHRLPSVISGSGGESRHIYFVTDRPFPSMKLAHSDEKFTDAAGKSHWAWEIELFGTGKQVAMPPSVHPDTGKPYEWEREFETDFDAPTIPGGLIEGFFGEEEDDGEGAEALGIDLDEARDILDGLPLEDWCDDREGWLHVGMALHHEFEGSDEAYRLWCRFSKRSDKFDEKVQRLTWRKFKANRPKPIRMATVKKAARDEQYRLDMESVIDEFDDLPEPAAAPEDDAPRARKGDPDMTILQQARFEAPPFPLHLFDKFWQREIEGAAENAAAPVDFVAGALLAMSGSIIGNARWVEVRKGWYEPPILWCQIVGPPSSNKSPAMNPFLAIASRLEAKWDPDYREQHRIWEGEKKVAEIKRKKWEAATKDIVEQGQDPGEMPEDCLAPPEPTKRRIFMNDATIEAMVRVLVGNERGLLNFRDELATWFGNFSRYSAGSDRSIWLEAYGGRQYVVDRVKDEGRVLRVNYFSVGILGGIQPERMLDMIGSANDGLLARFLTFWPEDSERKFSMGSTHEPQMEVAMERLSELMMRRTPEGKREPVYVPFSKAALERFRDWVDNRLPEERYAPSRMRDVYGKANGHVARLALIFEFMDWASDLFDEDDPREVSLRSVERAIEFREKYIKPMQMRVYGHGAETDEARMAKDVAEWIVSNEAESVNAYSLRRSGGIPGLSGRTDPERLDDALSYLVSIRWLIPDEPDKRSRGRPKKDYLVNERVWDLLK